MAAFGQRRRLPNTWRCLVEGYAKIPERFLRVMKNNEFSGGKDRSINSCRTVIYRAILIGQRHFWWKPSIFVARSVSEGLYLTRSLAYASGYYFG